MKLSPKTSIFIVFGYEKNNQTRRAGEKNNLAPILSEKNSGPDINPSPPPPPPPPQNINGPCLIPTMFHQNPSSDSGEEVENVKSLQTDDGRVTTDRRTDDGRYAMTIAHSSLRLR